MKSQDQLLSTAHIHIQLLQKRIQGIIYSIQASDEISDQDQWMLQHLQETLASHKRQEETIIQLSQSHENH